MAGGALRGAERLQRAVRTDDPAGRGSESGRAAGDGGHDPRDGLLDRKLVALRGFGVRGRMGADRPEVGPRKRRFPLRIRRQRRSVAQGDDPHPVRRPRLRGGDVAGRGHRRPDTDRHARKRRAAGRGMPRDDDPFQQPRTRSGTCAARNRLRRGERRRVDRRRDARRRIAALQGGGQHDRSHALRHDNPLGRRRQRHALRDPRHRHAKHRSAAPDDDARRGDPRGGGLRRDVRTGVRVQHHGNLR